MAVEKTASDDARVARDLTGLVGYAVEHGLVEPMDARWAYNALLEALGLMGPAPLDWLGETDDDFDLEAACERLGEVAVATGAADDTPSGRDRALTRAMGVLTPRPSAVAERFGKLRQDSPTAATDWFYRMSCDVRYVREAAIAKNVSWESPSRWGELEITINLSKPEKDPVAIAAAGAAPTGEKYPACQLCMENEGYLGRGADAPHGDHPARQNLRIVPIELGGEPWGLQYSPYAYFNEHCIAMSEQHRPMHVDRDNLGRLLDFVDLFPHYFIGSNADLPIVGGSILSHDHFQGGRHTFPMMRAEVDESFSIPGWPGVSCAVLRWPLTVLRLTSANRAAVLDAACHVLDVWRDWTDESVGVLAKTDATPHNTVSPICRCVTGGDGVRRYELCLALRCNVTTERYPLGVFHPHPEWHHIKKENIGLIEVMGLAILPPRLVEELGAVESHLVARDLDALDADPLSAPHAAWAHELLDAHPELDADNAEKILRDGVGDVFGHVLEDAGVYKWDEAGRSGLHRFLAAL